MKVRQGSGVESEVTLKKWEGFSTANEGRKRLFQGEGKAFVKTWRLENL